MAQRRVIGRIAGGQVAAIHTDQVGRPEVVTDVSHAVIWRAQNFAFGQTVVAGSSALNVGLPKPAGGYPWLSPRFST